MIGSIVGDIIGSVYEFHNQKRKDIELDTPNMRFTDDTILTVATMDALLHPEIGYAKMYKKYFRKIKIFFDVMIREMTILFFI